MEKYLHQAHPSFVHWLRTYARISKLINDSPEEPHFFLDRYSSSYMGLGDFLQKYSNTSSPCLLYDTDIHLTPTPNEGVFTRTHYIYICALSDEQDNEYEINKTKQFLLYIFDNLFRWFSMCKKANANNHNYVLHGASLSFNVDSTTTFLNGWEALRIAVSYPHKISCFDEHTMDFTR